MQKTRMSPEEYLAFERAAEEKHEYVNGEMFAKPRANFYHCAVAAHLLAELGNALRARGCGVLGSDMRTKIAATNSYVYPDGSVVCGPPELEDDNRDNLLNPRVVVEVLSDASEAYDRGDKFEQYRTVPALQEYMLASQKEPRIEVFRREADGSWTLRIHGAGANVELASLGCMIEVDRIYEGVFDAPSAAG